MEQEDMILYTNGCSFTYGDELENPEQDRWSTVLANMMNYTSVCEAQPGQSNADIVNQSINWRYDVDLAVIQFTTYLRPNFTGSIDKLYSDVLSLQTYYKAKQIPYRFLNGFDNQQHQDLSHPLVEYIDTTQFIGWPDEGITEWVYNSKSMPKGHPSKEQHQLIAEIIYGHYRS